MTGASAWDVTVTLPPLLNPWIQAVTLYANPEKYLQIVQNDLQIPGR